MDSLSLWRPPFSSGNSWSVHVVLNWCLRYIGVSHSGRVWPNLEWHCCGPAPQCVCDNWWVILRKLIWTPRLSPCFMAAAWLMNNGSPNDRQQHIILKGWTVLGVLGSAGYMIEWHHGSHGLPLWMTLGEGHQLCIDKCGWAAVKLPGTLGHTIPTSGCGAYIW